jgi:hypothetical protein
MRYTRNNKERKRTFNLIVAARNALIIISLSGCVFNLFQYLLTNLKYQ